MGQVAMLIKPLWRELERLHLEVVATPFDSVAQMASLLARPNLYDWIKIHHKGDPSFEFIKVEINIKKMKDFTIAKDKVLYC